MSGIQRLLLLVSSLFIVVYIALRIRKRRIRIEDSLPWVAFSFLLLLLAAFPQLAIFFADLLGFISAANFVYLIVIGLLVIMQFQATSEISLLKHKVSELTQEVALMAHELPESEGEQRGDKRRAG